MKTLPALSIGAVALLANGVALAQSGNMMNGSSWGIGGMGEYGGVWMPILLVVVVIALVALIFKRGDK